VDCAVEDNLDEFISKLNQQGKQLSKNKSQAEVDEDEIMFSFDYIDDEHTKWLKNNTNV
jgi:hypothetical protein